MENHHFSWGNHLFSYGKSPLFRFPLGSSVGFIRWSIPLAQNLLGDNTAIIGWHNFTRSFLKHVSSKLKIMEFHCEAVEAPGVCPKSCGCSH